MKKTLSFVFAAIAVLTVASCAREMLEPVETGSGEKVTFNLSLAENASKTSLEAGKTVWAENDTILLADGSKTLKVGIPTEAVGQAVAAISIDISKINVYGDLYAIYPPAAYSSIASGNVVVKVASDQSGRFDEANICVAKCTNPDNNFALRNSTALLKLSVADGVETVMISAAQADTLAGNVTVTYSKEEALKVKAASPVKSVKLALGGVGDDYYVAVVPGKYTEFSVLALSLDGKSQRKTTTNKTLAVNDLADLGTIGDDMGGASMEGTGAEDDPFLIKDLAEITTLATFVSNGLNYADNYFKVVNDIEGVSMPIGTFDQVDLPFKGHLDGQNHTITLDMGGDGVADGYLGLFGSLGAGSSVKDLTIAGTVSTAGDYVGALAGYSNVGTAGTSITNVTNSATVNGGSYVGGLVGYITAGASGAYTFENCHNTGAVTSTGHTAGGIVGYALYGVVKDCDNSGAVETKVSNGAVYTLPKGSYVYADFDGVTNVSNSGTVARGTGGIIGLTYNTAVATCVNNGPVTGVQKVGGVAGAIYWGSVTSCKNTAAVTASADIAGGIAGLQWVAGGIKENVNEGTVSARGVVGGILGMSCGQERSSAAYLDIFDNTNDGDVASVGLTAANEYNYGFANLSAAGGIVGGHRCFNKDWIRIQGCVNNGTVTGLGQGVGGILGYMGNPRNGSDQGYIDSCVNNGDVSCDVYRAGGIVGILFGRFTTCRMTVRNCVNAGSVSAPYVAAGLIAWGGPAYPAKDSDEKYKLYNCINLGEISATSETVENVYTGTLCGYIQQIDIQNCYNAGTVNLVEGVATNACAGLLFGIPNAYNKINYCYAAYDEDVYTKIQAGNGVIAGILYGVNKGATSTVNNTLMVNLEGMFDNDVTVSSTVCSDPLAALNAWVGTSTTYKQWVEGDNGLEFAE